MISKILVVRKVAKGQAITIKAFRTDETLIGISYSTVGSKDRGFFVDNKRVKAGHCKNKYFNDFATLMTMASEMTKKL